MPAVSWSQLNSNIFPLPAWRFYVTLPDIAGQSESPAPHASSERLSLSVLRATCPWGAIETETVPFRAGQRAFPNGRSIESLTLTLMEDATLSTLLYFRAWSHMVINARGNYGLPSAYKQTITLEPMNVVGQSVGVLSWNSCFPTHITGYDFDGSVTAFVSPTITFSVDTAGTNASTNASNGAGGYFDSNVFGDLYGTLDAVNLGLDVASTLLGDIGF